MNTIESEIASILTRADLTPECRALLKQASKAQGIPFLPKNSAPRDNCRDCYGWGYTCPQNASERRNCSACQGTGVRQMPTAAHGDGSGDVLSTK